MEFWVFGGNGVGLRLVQGASGSRKRVCSELTGVSGELYLRLGLRDAAQGSWSIEEPWPAAGGCMVGSPQDTCGWRCLPAAGGRGMAVMMFYALIREVPVFKCIMDN